MNQINEQQSAQQKDAVLQASLDFISTLTGMTPPPIEVAPPEVFAPFKAFADRVCAIFSQPLAPISGLSCACVFQGGECVEQCKLDAAWEETLHDEAEELKHLRAAVAKAGGAAPSPAWCASVDAELAATADADARALPDAARLFDAANRLVTHADYKLGGILSADSKARDIPSNACSQVKARHLAALRDAVNAFGEADQGHTPTLPATAVAEGAQLDGESLEQGE